MAPTPQQVADRWESAASGATSRYADGIQSTTVDVAARAIAAQGALLSNFQNAVNSGRWARRITESGGTANWKSQSLAKQGNYGTGIAAGKNRFQTAMQSLLPYIESGQSQVDSMPSGTLAASKARATFWIDYMSAYKNR